MPATGPPALVGRTPGFFGPRTGMFRLVPGIPDPQDLEISASVLPPLAEQQTFMVLGGGGVGQSNSAIARTALIDVAALNPHWVWGPDLVEPTRYPITVLLPTTRCW